MPKLVPLPTEDVPVGTYRILNATLAQSAGELGTQLAISTQQLTTQEVTTLASPGDYAYSMQDLETYWENYDYKGALLFVMGLLTVYGLAILFLIISLIRKSRTELELVDHLHDFEAMRRKTIHKRRTRDSIRSSLGSTDGTVPPPSSPAPLRPAIRRPLLQRSQRVEDESDDDLWLNPPTNPTFNKPRKILSYNPSLLRDDTFDKEEIDFIIV